MNRTHAVRPVTVKASGITLSGLAVAPQAGAARGLVLALHGGGYSASYWHCPMDDGCASLMHVAADLGFHVLAVDRPGYGVSADHNPANLGLNDQVDCLFGAIDDWRLKGEFDGPVFIIGHSIGGMLALLMAADPRADQIAAIDVLGVPLAFSAGTVGDEVQSWVAEGSHVPMLDENLHRQLMFGPAGSFSEQALIHDRELRRPMPVAEYHDAIAMPVRWADILPDIRIPVQLTMAEAEAMQLVGPEVLQLARDLLRNSVYARIGEQRASGHNASMHHIARSYHLRALAFFEEAMALARI